MPVDLNEKSICGVMHVRKQCTWCKELVWRDKRLVMAFVCHTCLESNLSPSTRGGFKIIKTGKEMA